jgi:hypothetical protein
MIGVVNPVCIAAPYLHKVSSLINLQNSTETFDIQLAYAKNATLMFSLGEYFPSEIVPTTSPISSSSYPTNTQTSSSTAEAGTSSKSLSDGGIAGVAIGGSAVLLLAAALLYLYGCHQTMAELIKRNRNLPLSYNTGYHSMSSNAIFSPKIPQSRVESLTPGRYSGARALYTGSPSGTESYRSRSPPIDETLEFMIPPLNLAGSPRSMSPLQSPLVGRPRADSPTYPMSMSRVTSMNEPIYRQPYQPLNMAEPPLRHVSCRGKVAQLLTVEYRLQRFNSQHGPQELPADLESGTATMQNWQQEFRNEKSSNQWDSPGWFFATLMNRNLCYFRSLGLSVAFVYIYQWLVSESLRSGYGGLKLRWNYYPIWI